MHPWDQGVVAIVSSRGEGGRGGGRWSQERGETELRDRKVRSMSARHTVRAFFPAKTLFFCAGTHDRRVPIENARMVRRDAVSRLGHDVLSWSCPRDTGVCEDITRHTHKPSPPLAYKVVVKHTHARALLRSLRAHKNRSSTCPSCRAPRISFPRISGPSAMVAASATKRITQCIADGGTAASITGDFECALP